MSGLLGRANTERSLRAKIGEVFNHTGQKGTYDYDFGSTTRLTIERTGARDGRIGRTSVRPRGDSCAALHPPVLPRVVRSQAPPGGVAAADVHLRAEMSLQDVTSRELVRELPHSFRKNVQEREMG
jgi:hypothetical protein